ncbi:MAG: hypothetical protein OD811_06230, partial [Alphaproteobacteria bacterium]
MLFQFFGIFGDPFLGVLPYPRIDPVAFSLGPFVLRWYALAYLVGVLSAWWLLRRVSYVVATGGFHSVIARFIEARDKASPGLGGASWTHASEGKSGRKSGSARRAAARRASQQRRRTRHGGRRSQRRTQRHAREEQRERLQTQMRSDLRSGGLSHETSEKSGESGESGGARKRRGTGGRGRKDRGG